MEYRGEEMKNKDNRKVQLIYGLVIGFIFGFLLQKGGVTKYDVIVGQLRLTDFTVLQVMISSVIVTMLGISYLLPKGMLKLEVKSGSVRNSVIGGLIFGLGFGILGYCPGTIAGAIGNGYLDALSGGLIGIITGSAIFAFFYPKLKSMKILTEDRFSKFSLFYQLKGNPFRFTVPFALFLILVLVLTEI